MLRISRLVSPGFSTNLILAGEGNVINGVSGDSKVGKVKTKAKSISKKY